MNRLANNPITNWVLLGVALSDLVWNLITLDPLDVTRAALFTLYFFVRVRSAMRLRA